MSDLFDDEGDIHHECGVAAVVDLNGKRNVVPDVVRLLTGLQHRGQLGAGIAWKRQQTHDHALGVLKNLGLVADVLTDEALAQAVAYGYAAIGHVRYATTASEDVKLCHPMHYPAGKSNREFAMAFNGNIPDYALQLARLRDSGIEPRFPNSDTEIIGQSIVHSMVNSTSGKLRKGIAEALGGIDGACNAVVLSDDGRIFATRDRHGFHPLAWAQHESLIAVASESEALEDLWPDIDVEVHTIWPGQMIRVHKNKDVTVDQLWTPEQARCFFEWIYFARAGSVIDGVSVSKARYRSGGYLAELDIHRPTSDIVVPVPDSSKPAARGYADKRGSDVSYVEAITRKPKKGRTFIDTGDRTEKVRQKFNFNEALIQGQSVMLVDDSIVRGTTMRVIVDELRSMGAKEVHVRLASPAILSPCFYGIDFPTVTELIARKYCGKEVLGADVLPPDVLHAIKEDIHADSIAFLPVSAVSKMLRMPENHICTACVTGRYPTEAGRHRHEIEEAKVE